MASEPTQRDAVGLFEAMYTARAIRRFKPDPVPDALILEVIEAGTMAPSASNGQPWVFVVVRDADTKRFVQQRYAQTFHGAYRRGRTQIDSAPAGSQARLMTAAAYLADHLSDAPVLLFCCVERNGARRPGREHEPRYDSIFPAVQNVLLACRGRGLGACLTTLHTFHEAEIHERLGIPPQYASPAMIPIGFPRDRHGSIRRRPAAEVTRWEHW